MNKFGKLMNHIEKVYNDVDSYCSKYYEKQVLFQSPYIISNTYEEFDYNGIPEIIDILRWMKNYDEKLTRIVISSKRDEKKNLIKIKQDEYTDLGIMDSLESIIYDGYNVRYSKHFVEKDGIKVPELVMNKNIQSELEPSIISNSGKALFHLWDNESKNYKFFDDEYIASNIIETDKQFFDWDEDEFIILRMSLPTSST